jgi:hypothetical protein
MLQSGHVTIGDELQPPGGRDDDRATGHGLPGLALSGIGITYCGEEFGVVKIVPTLEMSGEKNLRSIQLLLEKVWDVYGKFSATQLTNMAHAIGTPWHQVFEEHGGRIPKYKVIPDKLIRDYFEAEAQKPKAVSA